MSSMYFGVGQRAGGQGGWGGWIKKLTLDLNFAAQFFHTQFHPKGTKIGKVSILGWVSGVVGWGIWGGWIKKNKKDYI